MVYGKIPNSDTEQVEKGEKSSRNNQVENGKRAVATIENTHRSRDEDAIEPNRRSGGFVKAEKNRVEAADWKR